MNSLSKEGKGVGGGRSVMPFFFMSEDVGSLSQLRGLTRDSTLGALDSVSHKRSVIDDSLNVSLWLVIEVLTKECQQT